ARPPLRVRGPYGQTRRTPLSTIPPHVAARARRVVGKPPRGLEPRPAPDHAARLAPGARAVADQVFPVDHRVGLRLLPEDLPDRRRDMAAVPLALAAGLTRVTGLALVAPLALRAWRRRTFGSVALAAAPIVAFAAHAAWLDHAVGDPLAMVHAQRQWGGHPSI